MADTVSAPHRCARYAATSSWDRTGSTTSAPWPCSSRSCVTVCTVCAGMRACMGRYVPSTNKRAASRRRAT